MDFFQNLCYSVNEAHCWLIPYGGNVLSVWADRQYIFCNQCFNILRTFYITDKMLAYVYCFGEVYLINIHSIVLLYAYIHCDNHWNVIHYYCICIKKDGGRITPYAASHKFSEFLKRNSLPHIRLNDLRHSCASLLIAQGVDIKIIQEWLGHSSIATTGNIYGHLQFKQKISTGIVLENLLSENALEKC